MEVISLSEFRDRFGTATERRKELCSRFEEWLGIAIGSSVLLRVWVYGSFVSDTPEPNDVDVLAVMAQSFNADSISRTARFWFELDILEAVQEIHLALFADSLPVTFIVDLLEWFAASRPDSVPGVEISL